MASKLSMSEEITNPSVTAIKTKGTTPTTTSPLPVVTTMDLTLYGATGFVARHVLQYLMHASFNDDTITAHCSVMVMDPDPLNGHHDRHRRHRRRPLQIALAGRDAVKLESMQHALTQSMSMMRTVHAASTNGNNKAENSVYGCDFHVVVVDANTSWTDLTAMTQQTSVVINGASFICGGANDNSRSSGSTGWLSSSLRDRIVEACVATDTHYVDIQHDVEWWGHIRHRHYHASNSSCTSSTSASSKTARFVSFCGHSALWSDLAVLVAVEALRDRVKKVQTHRQVHHQSKMGDNVAAGTVNHPSFDDDHGKDDTVPVAIVQATTWHVMQGPWYNHATLQTWVEQSTTRKRQQQQQKQRSSPSVRNRFPSTTYWGGDPLALVDPAWLSVPDNTVKTLSKTKTAATTTASNERSENVIKLDLDRLRCHMAWTEWLNLLPTMETIFRMGTSIPSIMAFANSKVVHASAVALQYAGSLQQPALFSYRERWLPAGYLFTTHLGFLSLIPAMLVELFMFLGMVLLCVFPFSRVAAILLHWFAPAGTGPSDAYCYAGQAQVYAQVSTAPDPTTGHVQRANCCLLINNADSYHAATAQCVTEAALTLLVAARRYDETLLPIVKDQDDTMNDTVDSMPLSLPPRSRDGFGTPAQLLGMALLRRLQQSPIRPVLVQTHVRSGVHPVEWRMFPNKPTPVY